MTTATNTTPEQAYMAQRSDCDCVTMVTMEGRKETAAEVAKAIRLGERVQRVTVETVRTTPLRCSLHNSSAVTS